MRKSAKLNFIQGIMNANGYEARNFEPQGAGVAFQFGEDGKMVVYSDKTSYETITKFKLSGKTRWTPDIKDTIQNIKNYLFDNKLGVAEVGYMDDARSSYGLDKYIYIRRNGTKHPWEK